MYKLFIIFFIALISCSEKAKVTNQPNISIEKNIKNRKILNLSDYAKDIQYIALQTSDTALVGNITHLIYEKQKIILNDSQNGIAQVFSQTGDFLFQIGRKGEGPEEYLGIRNMSIVPHSDRQALFIDAYPKRFFIYDLKRRSFRKISYPEYPDTYMPWQTIAIDPSIYFSNLTSMKHLYYRGLFFGKDSTCQTSLFQNYIDRELEGRQSYGGYETAYMWNYHDTIRYYRILNDTVFVLTPQHKTIPKYIFDFGTYKADPIDLLKHKDISQKIHINQITAETDQYIFLRFNFNRIAPELFQQERINPRTGIKRVVEIKDVYGLFDKKTGELTFLNQPVKHKYLGFRNDLDGGPVFWPKYISSDGEMVTWFLAEDFLDIYEQLPSPSKELKAFAEQLQPDDNPVLMVVKLK